MPRRAARVRTAVYAGPSVREAGSAASDTTAVALNSESVERANRNADAAAAATTSAVAHGCRASVLNASTAGRRLPIARLESSPLRRTMADESTGLRPPDLTAAPADRLARGAVVIGGVSAAAAAGALAARDEWPWVVLVCLLALGAFAFTADGVVAGVLVALSAGLPLYDSALAELGAGAGLLTVLLSIAAVAALAAGARRARSLPLPDRRVAAVVVFPIVIALSVLVGPRGDSTLGLAKTYAALTFVLPATLALAVASRTRPGAVRLAGALALTVCVVAVVGSALSVAQALFGTGYPILEGDPDALEKFVGVRATGLSEHPNTWAAFLLLAFGLLGATAVRTRNLVAAVAALAVVLSLGLTASRSGWLAAAVGAAVLVAAAGRRAFVFGGVLVVAAAVAFTLGAATRDTFDAGLFSDDAASERLLYARAELELGRRHPLRGVGLGNIGTAIGELPPDMLRSESSGGAPPTVIRPGDYTDRHSTYLGLFAEQGVLGVASFVVALAVGLWALVSGRRRARTADEVVLVEGLLVALVATAVVAAFSEADRQPFLWWIVGVSLGLHLVFGRPEAQRPGA
jgi:O-antigen ligase